jgi:hypothetical protein
VYGNDLLGSSLNLQVTHKVDQGEKMAIPPEGPVRAATGTPEAGRVDQLG